MTAKEPQSIGVERLAERLQAASGPRDRLIPLTAAATVMSLMGMPTKLHNLAWSHFAAAPTAMGDMRMIWKELVLEHGYLEGHLDVLLDWTNDPSEEDAAALARCFDVFAGIDMLATLHRPEIDGELLGPLYTMLSSNGQRKAYGQFYTPMTVCKLLAKMNDTQDGDTVNDPCCGAGAMLVAVAKVMRKQGRHPESVHWVMNDIDPIAVALAGVNASVFGFGQHVTLTCADALRSPITA